MQPKDLGRVALEDLLRIRVFQQAPYEGLTGVERDVGAVVGGWVVVSGLVESREVGGVDTPRSFGRGGVGRVLVAWVGLRWTVQIRVGTGLRHAVLGYRY